MFDTAHLPPEQMSGEEQAWPHWPQLAGSLLVSTQAWPHIVSEPHDVAQAPLAHTPPGHECPHWPQLAGSLVVSTQLPLHAVAFPGQLLAHVPVEHTSVAPHA
jgi:hypothetical protein